MTNFNIAVIFGFLVFSVSGFAQNAPPFKVVSGCQQADYVVGKDPALVQIDGAHFAFTPKCLTVPVGTMVTIHGASFHPVQGQPAVNEVANPFFNAAGGATAPTTKQLTTPGFYGYYCVNHGSPDGHGMAGAIWVQ